MSERTRQAASRLVSDIADDIHICDAIRELLDATSMDVPLPTEPWHHDRDTLWRAALVDAAHAAADPTPVRLRRAIETATLLDALDHPSAYGHARRTA